MPLVTSRNAAATIDETSFFYVIKSDGTAEWKAALSVVRDEILAPTEAAAGILTALKTVDGAGSGLDSDLLDGNEAAAFASAAQGALADSAVQPGDNVSDLTNDSGFTDDTAANAAQATADAALPKAGGEISGNITCAGAETFDGRDVSADGAKLDLIEANATADQSDAEIKTAYQNEVPLISQAAAEAGVATGIESWSALRVAQAIAALAAGGLSSSDINTLSKLNAIVADATLGDASDFATAAQGGLADSAVQPGDNISDLNNDSGFTDDTAADAAQATADAAVAKALYDANTILAADSDNTPAALTVAEQTLVGRITAGNIDALTAAEVRTLLNIEDGATADQSAAEILAAIKTVDGPASGLDADLLDGNEAAAFATAAQGALADSALQSVAVSDLDDGTDGELITWDSDGHPDTVAAGTSGQVLTSNGPGAAPTFQDAATGTPEGTAILSTGPVTDGYVLTADGAGGAAWEAPAGGGLSDVVDDTTPQAGGDFDLNAHQLIQSASADSVIKLADNAGAYSLSIHDSDDAEVFAIDSGGNVQCDGFQVKNADGSATLIKIDNAGTNSGIVIGSGASITSASNGPIAIGNSAKTSSGGISIGTNANLYGSYGLGSIAIGPNTYTSGVGIALGNKSTSAQHQALAICGETFSASGDNQFLLWQPANTTADNTPTALYMDEDGASKLMTVAAGKTYLFEAHVCGVQSDGSDAYYFVRKGIICNVGGTTALIGTIQTVGTDIDSSSSSSVAITADDINDALQIEVTNPNSETWRSSANVFVKDITFGT